jgi:predicted nucleotidyltransferase
VDIVPFGEIESETRTITWSNDFRLDVFGFREAFASAVQVRLPGGLVVAVASLPAQSLLKLFAWRDRRYQSRRDAVDLKAILCAYHEGRYFEELYAEYGSLLDKHDFDHQLAGAERIGREACALIGDMGGAPDVNGALLSAYRDGFG